MSTVDWTMRRMRVQSFTASKAERATEQANTWLDEHPDARLWDIRTALVYADGVVGFVLTMMVDILPDAGPSIEQLQFGMQP